MLEGGHTHGYHQMCDGCQVEERQVCPEALEQKWTSGLKLRFTESHCSVRGQHRTMCMGRVGVE